MHSLTNNSLLLPKKKQIISFTTFRSHHDDPDTNNQLITEHMHLHPSTVCSFLIFFKVQPCSYSTGSKHTLPMLVVITKPLLVLMSKALTLPSLPG